jgi:hypothetical protein
LNQTLIKPDLLGFSRIWCLCMWVAWPRNHEIRIIWYQSLAPLFRLYLFEIFASLWFRKKNSLVSKFLFSVNLWHIIKKKKKLKVVQKTFICFCCKKLIKVKLDQINLELAQISYSHYWGPNHTTYYLWGQLDIICLGFQIWFWSGLIHNVFASAYQTLL